MTVSEIYIVPDVLRMRAISVSKAMGWVKDDGVITPDNTTSYEEEWCFARQK